MTNQEAIETIKANYPPENYSMLREALDIAIGLLKEQETELCDRCGRRRLSKTAGTNNVPLKW